MCFHLCGGPLGGEGAAALTAPAPCCRCEDLHHWEEESDAGQERGECGAGSWFCPEPHPLKVGFCSGFQLGAKKGLGAQKVSSKSFSEVEKQAQVAEKLREEQAAEAKKHAEESM